MENGKQGLFVPTLHIEKKFDHYIYFLKTGQGKAVMKRQVDTILSVVRDSRHSQELGLRAPDWK